MYSEAPQTFAKLSGLTLVAAVHAIGIGCLLQLEPLRSATIQAAPIMVQLVAPPITQKVDAAPRPLPARPRVELPKATPKRHMVRPKYQPKAPIIISPYEAPPSFVPAAPPEPVELPQERTAAVVPSPEPLAPPVPIPVTPPRFNAGYLSNPAPRYPSLSRRMGEEGKVLLRVFVSEHGRPEIVQLKSSSGYSRLDSVALDTVKQWKFVPARRWDQPVAAWVVVPISFSLRS